MSISSIQDVANIEYSGLYIPIASWFYIFYETQSEFAFYALPVVILGATITHGIFYSIFGHEGPKNHPKKNWTVVGYSLALMYTKSPGRTPDSIEEFQQRFQDAFTVLRGIRLVVFLSICLTYVLLTAYSLLPLFQFLMENPDLIGGALFLTQAVFIVQGVMRNRFASVLPPEEAKWVWVPEYRRVQEVYSEEGYEDSEFRDPPMIFEEIREILDDMVSRMEAHPESDTKIRKQE